MISGFGKRGAVAVAALLLSLAGGATLASARERAPLVPLVQNFDLRVQMGPSSAAPLVRAVFIPATPSPLGSPTLAPPGPALAIVVPQAFSTVPGAAPADGYSTLPLAALVDANSDGVLDAEDICLATAVYFESKGESLEGQLAVAHVVMNRAVSGRYPTSLCGVVRQRAQFSFVRRGTFPRVNQACEAWRKARAIARVARLNLTPALPRDVLWYHADYVAPRWRQTLIRFEKVGRHIFYRA